jgi:prepilin-type N-terminal cleavage/methylation domain-containing protein
MAHRRSGFSLLELVITLSLIAILVGVVGFRSTSVLDKGKISSISQLVRNLKTACALYHSDTGLYPYEYSNYPAVHRKLSGAQTGTAGWAGPYLEKPFASNATNPYGLVHLYNNLNTTVGGYDIDGNGQVEATGNGCSLVLWNIERPVAEALNKVFDEGIPGDWEQTGQVKYLAGARQLGIMIYR